jgi:hypothetical protein
MLIYLQITLHGQSSLELQFATLGDNKKNLCDVNLIDTMEVIYKK